MVESLWDRKFYYPPEEVPLFCWYRSQLVYVILTKGLVFHPRYSFCWCDITKYCKISFRFDSTKCVNKSPAFDITQRVLSSADCFVLIKFGTSSPGESTQLSIWLLKGQSTVRICLICNDWNWFFLYFLLFLTSADEGPFVHFEVCEIFLETCPGLS